MEHDPQIQTLKANHTPKAIEVRLSKKPKRSYLKDFVFGGMDGAVTTFAVVSGVAGAGLSSGVLIILGFANLFGDGFSMAVGALLSAKTEKEMLQRARKREEYHIEKYPEGEKEEIRQIYRAKGFEGEELERIVTVISSDKARWIDTMVHEEWGLSLESPNPLRTGIVTFAAFFLVGLLPLFSFIIKWISPDLPFDPFWASFMITGFAFFIVGSLKGQFVGKNAVITGIEALLLGGCASALAYGVGAFLKNIVTM